MGSDEGLAAEGRHGAGDTSSPQAEARVAGTREDGAAGNGVLATDFAMANPPSVDIPAMICQAEKNYYYWLTSNLATGAGAVVEFGTWLGASTAYLSAGLGGRSMYCYDHFEWFGYDNWKSDIKLNEGDDFTHLFLRNVERYKINAVISKTKLEDATWGGGPVELLIIDAPKRGAQLARLLTVFAPSFIPGKTRIVLQDYQHFASYELAVVIDAIRSDVELEHVVVAVGNNSQPNTVAFRVTEPIDVAPLGTIADDMATWSVERIHETWSRMMAPLPDQARARMAPALTLDALADRYGVSSLDVLVIDAEGCDDIVLGSFDIETQRPKLILFEHVHLSLEGSTALRDRLLAANYTCIADRHGVLAILDGVFARHFVNFLADVMREARKN